MRIAVLKEMWILNLIEFVKKELLIFSYTKSILLVSLYS